MPNRSPVRRIADIAFWAAMVPSITATPPSHTSQLPQGRRRFRRNSQAGSDAGSAATSHSDTSALSRNRSTRFCSSEALLSSIWRRRRRDVAGAVECERVGRQPVAPGAADLLVVALDVVRHVGVADEAHVRLVDPHAERDGRHHHDAVLLQEDVLVARAVGGVHAGMIGQRLDSFARGEHRRALRYGAREPQ